MLRRSFKSLSPVNRTNCKTVEEWLDNLDLADYKPLFVKHRKVEDLLKLSESSLKKLGVKSSAHRAKMMSSIALLRDSLKRSKSSGANSEKALRLERLKQEAMIPRSIYKLMFYSNKTLTSPIGIVPSLNLPSTRDLESMNWYHGLISRLEAESLVMKEGDFLVRDSTSHPGELVLTCYRQNIPMHFVINCLEYHKGSSNISEKFYKFDDDVFPSVSSLINCHLESGKAITTTSGAVLRDPIPSQRKVITNAKTLMLNKERSSDISFKDKWTGSQPLLSLDEASSFKCKSGSSLVVPLERYGSMPSMLKSNRDLSKRDLDPRTCTSSRDRLDESLPLPRSSQAGKSPMTSITNNSSTIQVINIDLYLQPDPSTTTAITTTTTTTTSPSSEQLPHPPPFLLTSPSSPPLSPSKPPPPPKPSRVPTLRFNEAGYKPMVTVRNHTLDEDDDDDDDDDENNGCKPGAAAATSDGQGMLKTVSPSSSFSSPPSSPACFTHITTHKSFFLPPNNKPLDSTAMSTIKSSILGTHPGTLAKHITYIDINIFKIVPFKDNDLNTASGLELLTLPQGQTLRQDVIERHHCMRMFVSSIVLNGQTIEERCKLISHWLTVAMELKTNMGNIFSFFSIIDALCSSQIVRLKSTWKYLKQHYRSSLEIFEVKLLPSYRNLLDASGVTLPYQRDTVTPHIFPLLELLERPSTVSEELTMWKLGSWEMNQPFFGLDVILIHLDTARLLTGRIHLYKDAAERFLSANNSSILIPDLLDLFDLRTQAKFLWGAKGVVADRAERFAKFDHLLSMLSEVLEKESEKTSGSLSQ